MRLKVQDTIKLLGFFPTIVLFLVSGYFLYISYMNYTSLQTLHKVAQNTVIANKLSIAIAKERGLSAIFLGSKGDIAKEELKKQRQLVDNAINEFLDYFEQQGDFSINIRNVLELLRNITAIRDSVDKLDVDFDKMFFNYYSKITRYLLNEEKKINEIDVDKVTIKNLTKITWLYSDIEYNGQERGLIAKILSQYVPFTDEEIKKWIKMFKKTDTFHPNIIINTHEYRKRFQDI